MCHYVFVYIVMSYLHFSDVVAGVAAPRYYVKSISCRSSTHTEHSNMLIHMDRSTYTCSNVGTVFAFVVAVRIVTW